MLSNPYENWKKDVALASMSRVIEIDLKEVMEEDIPKALVPERGTLT